MQSRNRFVAGLSSRGVTLRLVGSSRHDPKLTRNIRVYDTLDALLTASEAAQDLAGHPGWQVVLTLLDAEISKIDAKLDGQLLDSRADYAREHGRRDGLRAAPALLTALVERAEAKLEDQRRRHEGAAEPALQEA